ncbi:MAG: hypothetical protein KDK45_20565 [Leptospiraceae bacterium]|nr:hypothetical protein [Leptospiraceae bacterium]
MILRWIFENWQAKILSFGLAILLYLNLQSSKITTREHYIPIRYPKLGKNLFYSDKNKQVYNVKLEGHKEIINLHLQDLHIDINEDELSPGTNEIEVKKVEGLPPKGIRVKLLEGPIKVVVDTLESRTIPIEVGFEKEPPPNYMKTSHQVSPSTLTISGPKKTIDKWNRYIAGKINLEDKRETFTRKFRINGLPGNLKLLSKAREVNVKVKIVKTSSDLSEQMVVGVPVRCEGLKKGLEAELSKKKISIKFYSPSNLNSFQIMQGIRATVPCLNTIDPETLEIKPAGESIEKVKVNKISADLKNVDIIEIIPESLTVKYSIRKKKKKDTKKPISTQPDEDPKKEKTDENKQPDKSDEKPGTEEEVGPPQEFPVEN